MEATRITTRVRILSGLTDHRIMLFGSDKNCGEIVFGLTAISGGNHWRQ